MTWRLDELGKTVSAVLFLWAAIANGDAKTAAIIAVTSPLEPADPANGWDKLQTTLAAIPVVTGGSAWDRMATCKMQIQTRGWFVGKANQDVPTVGIKAGDLLVDVTFDLPRPPGTGTEQADQITYRGMIARWHIRRGQPVPQNGWAEQIQFRPAPLDWMQC
jgi:hypothetical protein